MCSVIRYIQQSGTSKWHQRTSENNREERDKNQESQSFYGLTFIFLTWSFHLSPYSTGNGVRVGYPTRMKSTQKKRNVHGQRQNFALEPNATYIPPIGVGVGIGANANFKFGVRGLASGNAKKLHKPTQNIPTCWYILRWVTQNSGVGCIAQRQPPMPGILHSGGI